MVYYISLFTKIRCSSFTYLPTYLKIWRHMWMLPKWCFGSWICSCWPDFVVFWSTPDGLLPCLWTHYYNQIWMWLNKCGIQCYLLPANCCFHRFVHVKPFKYLFVSENGYENCLFCLNEFQPRPGLLGSKIVKTKM